MHVRELPPLRLHIDAVSPSGRHYRWGPDERRPENVPDGLRFSDTMPGGFESMDCALARKPRTDYADLERLSTLRVLGAGGDVAWEGRLERAPRTSGDQMAVSPSAVGWQAHLEDYKAATIIYMDRDLGRWKGMSRQRRVDAGSTFNPQNDGQIAPDTERPALKLECTGHLPGSAGGFSESWYDAGAGNLIAGLVLGSTETRNATNFDFAAYGADDDRLTGVTAPIGVASDADPLSTLYRALATPKRWLRLQFVELLGTYTGDENERWRMVDNVAVIGDHGLTLQVVSGGADGFLASDIVAHALARFAPHLRVADDSIAPSIFVVPQLAFPEPTTSAEIVRQATRFGLQDWAVWDDKTFYWHERGARGRSWRARIGPSGLEETGPQLDRLWESILVQYQDVDGSTRTVGPPDSGADTESADLKDDDPENPANKLGITRRDLLTMGVGTAAGAIEVGQRFLEQTKLFDSSGRARIVGHVMDDHGILHPYWRMRAGDTISFIDAADTSPRRIVKTEKSTADRSCAVDLDAPPDAMAALLERLGVVLVPLGV